MHAYCVDELRLSEDAAAKRIQASRAAREFPALFTELAEGRLHLAAVCLLAPHLNAENVDELIRAATHKRKSEVEVMLARRYALSEMIPKIHPIPAMTYEERHAPGHVEQGIGAHSFDLGESPREHAQGTPDTATSDTATSAARTATERYFLQFSIGKSTHDKLRYVQGLLSHSVPAGDVAEVLDRALDALTVELERRKVGARARRPRLHPASLSRRYVSAEIRRAVWERDGGQCTFVSRRGNRCKATRFLEFDHVVPVARGGKATVEGVRLRCRAHNQYEAERALGARFMSRKRLEARLERAAAKEQSKERSQDLVTALRGLGCSAQEARRAADLAEAAPSASLEERLRAALRLISRRTIQASTSAGARSQ